MKRDYVIPVIAIIAIAGICYGLAVMRPQFRPTPPQPFSPMPPSISNAPTEKAIIEVNGEPITEKEFEIFAKQMPEEMQRQFASPQGKQAVADNLIRLKLLEQQARKSGVEDDPQLKAILGVDKMMLAARMQMQKLVPPPSDAELRAWYDKNKNMFDSIELSHILIAYQGGQAPPRSGGQPPSRQEAMKKAMAVEDALKKGANFAAVARDVSDDTASAQQGGMIGPVSHGMMPPELEAKVFTLKQGEISQPIPSRFGIHIFQAGPHTARPFNEVKAFIAQQIQQDSVNQRVEDLRKNAKVVFDPKEFPESRTPPQPSVKKPG